MARAVLKVRTARPAASAGRMQIVSMLLNSTGPCNFWEQHLHIVSERILAYKYTDKKSIDAQLSSGKTQQDVRERKELFTSTYYFV